MSVNSAAGGAAGEIAGAGPSSAWPARALRLWLAATLTAESGRLVLWLPVAWGAGIVAFFSLAAEPPAWLAPVGVLTAAATFGVCRGRRVTRLAALGLLAGALGFALAQAKTAWVAAPRLAKPLGPVMISGTIATAEPNRRGWRIVLKSPAIEGLAPDRTPRTVRINVRNEPPPAGRPVRVRASLMPLPGPALPGGYDFQRHAWFEELGAVGYSLGPVEEIEGAGDAGFMRRVSALRQDIDARIRDSLATDDPRDTGWALASALITGIRGAVSEEVNVAMRNSGLAHLLSISGLHLSLVAGLVFLIVRAGLALVPVLALRWQTRKIAAAVALLVSTGYLLLSGASVPTQRSFIMLAFALGAILIDRLQISMRPVALAALAVMVLAPESVLGPSFQLSFGAVVALVAAYEAAGRWRARRRAAGVAPWSQLWAYPAGLAFTSLVATLATTPIGASHFNQAALYAIPANMIAVPVTGVWGMPWGLAALLAMPFGLEDIPLRAMAAGIDIVVWAAMETSSWPGAVAHGLIIPPAGLAAIALGGLWLALWQTAWRLTGLPVLACGLATMIFATPPDIVLSGDGRLAAVRDADGRMLASSLRSGAFEREAWARHMGTVGTSAWPRAMSAGGAMSCDAAACLYRRNGRLAVFVRHESALAVDCPLADVVVVTAPVSSRLLARACPAPKVIRYADLRRDGTHTLRFDIDAVAVNTVRGARGDRPWTGAATPVQ